MQQLIINTRHKNLVDGCKTWCNEKILYLTSSFYKLISLYIDNVIRVKLFEMFHSNRYMQHETLFWTLFSTASINIILATKTLRKQGFKVVDCIKGYSEGKLKALQYLYFCAKMIIANTHYWKIYSFWVILTSQTLSLDAFTVMR